MKTYPRLVLVLAFIMLDGMVCVGWNNVIFAPSSPLSSPLFLSGHLLSDQLNKTF